MQRLAPLDGLRGLAALAVVGFHYLYFGPTLFPALGDSLDPLKVLKQGVQLFFIISGFVIMMSISRGTLRDFAASRISRFYPVYWVSILITFAVATLGLPGYGVTAWDALVNLTMLQSYLGIQHVDGVYWTLAVELAFYVQIAILSACGLLNDRRLVPSLYGWLMAASIVTAAVFLFGLPAANPFAADVILQLFKWMPYFISGVAAYLIVTGKRSVAVYALPVVAWVAAAATDSFTGVGKFSIAFTLLVLLVILWRPLGTDTRPLRFLGEISYALYVIHEFVGYVMLLRLDDSGVPRPIALLVTLAIVLGLASAITYWVDKPLRGKLRAALTSRPRETATLSS